MADKKNISSTKSLIENDKLKEYLKDNLSEELNRSAAPPLPSDGRGLG